MTMPNHVANWTQEFKNETLKILKEKYGFDINDCSDEEWYATVFYDEGNTGEIHFFEFGTFHGGDIVRWGAYANGNPWGKEIPLNQHPGNSSPEIIAHLIATEEQIYRGKNNFNC